MPARLLEKSFDALAVGERETTRSRTITEADIVGFCTLSGDMYPLHTDDVVAKRSHFGARVAPGMLVYSYAFGLGVPPDSATIMANYGSERVRFPAPVFIGDTLGLTMEVRAKRERDAESGIVTLLWEMRNQHERVVCAAEVMILMARRSAA